MAPDGQPYFPAFPYPFYADFTDQDIADLWAAFQTVPPHDRTGHTWHHGDGLLFAYTKLGGAETLKRMGVTGVQSGMPGFGDSLTDAEIRDILGFITSSWTERERGMQHLRTQAEGGGVFEEFR